MRSEKRGRSQGHHTIFWISGDMLSIGGLQVHFERWVDSVAKDQGHKQMGMWEAGIKVHAFCCYHGASASSYRAHIILQWLWLPHAFHLGSSWMMSPSPKLTTLIAHSSTAVILLTRNQLEGMRIVQHDALQNPIEISSRVPLQSRRLKQPTSFLVVPIC